MARSQELARPVPSNHTPRQCNAFTLPRDLAGLTSTTARPAGQLAERFQLHVDSVRAIVRDFARDPDINSFFTVDWPGPKTSPKRTAIDQRACELRHQGHTLAETRATLLREGFDISEPYLFSASLRRARFDHDPVPSLDARNRASPPTMARCVPDIARRSSASLSLDDGRRFPTKESPASSCFFPCYSISSLPRAVAEARLLRLGGDPADPCVSRLAGPRLARKASQSVISATSVMTRAPGLFTELSMCCPKVTYATDSFLQDRADHDRKADRCSDRQDPLEAIHLLEASTSTSTPSPFVAPSPTWKTTGFRCGSRALPSVMAFVAQAASRRVICYATANVLRAEADSLVPKFAEYWKAQTGRYPARLLFDSRATTYAGLRPTQPASGRFHHDSPPWPESAGTR